MVGFEALVSYPTIHNSLHTWIISLEGNVDCAIFLAHTIQVPYHLCLKCVSVGISKDIEARLARRLISWLRTNFMRLVYGFVRDR